MMLHSPNALSLPPTPPVSGPATAWIAQAGCCVAFGYPGIAIDPWLHGLQGVLPVRMARHELCAAYMALGAARYALQPAAVLATSGPGAQLMLAAARTAQSDRVPVLFISGGTGSRQQFQSSRHDGDVFAALGLPSMLIGTAPTPAECDRLKGLLAGGQPVHVQLDPRTGDAPLAGGEHKQRQAAPLPRPGDLLVAAHPLLGRDRGAWRAFARERGLACGSTLLARGVFDEADPSFRGVWRLDAEPPEAWNSFSMIHLLGGWQPPGSAPGPVMPVRCIPLEQLAEWPLPTKHAPQPAADGRRLAASEAPADPLGQAAGAVFAAVWCGLPHGVPLFVDAGELRRAACTLPEPDDPRELILCEREAPMGFAMVAALGAASAQSGPPVAALMGDGSFLMHATELSTAAQERLPLVGVVHCNGVLASPYQRAGESALRDQFRLPPFDGPALCQSLGVQGRKVSQADLAGDLALALKQAAQQPQMLFVT